MHQKHFSKVGFERCLQMKKLNKYRKVQFLFIRSQLYQRFAILDWWAVWMTSPPNTAPPLQHLNIENESLCVSCNQILEKGASTNMQPSSGCYRLKCEFFLHTNSPKKLKHHLQFEFHSCWLESEAFISISWYAWAHWKGCSLLQQILCHFRQFSLTSLYFHLAQTASVCCENVNMHQEAV